MASRVGARALAIAEGRRGNKSLGEGLGGKALEVRAGSKEDSDGQVIASLAGRGWGPGRGNARGSIKTGWILLRVCL
jgi:hypothetical protein